MNFLKFFLLLTSINIFAGTCEQISPRFVVVARPTFDFDRDIPLSRLRVFRPERVNESGFLKLDPIVFQVDEVNKNGDFVLDKGEPYTANTGDDVFNGQDELSLRLKELGTEDFSQAQLSPKDRERFDTLYKLKLKVTGDCEKFALIGTLKPGATSNSSDRLFPKETSPRFNELEKRISTAGYLYNFNLESPMVLGSVLVRPQLKVFEKASFVMPLKTRQWWLPNFEFGHADFESLIECWREGPLRTIVAIGAKYRRFFSLINLHLFSELIFYDHSFSIPTKIEFTFDTDQFLKRGSGLGYLLKLHNPRDWNLSTNLPVLPDHIPGEKDGTAASISNGGADQPDFYAEGWFKNQGFWMGVQVDRKAQEMVPPPYLIQAEQLKRPAFLESWPWLKGSSADLGVYLDIAGISKGLYDFSLNVFLLDKTQPSNDHKVKTRVFFEKL